MLGKFKTYICLLALPIPLASCQLEDLYALDESCPNFSGIYHQTTQICERKAPHHCKDILSTLKLSDYQGAFKYERCPIGYRCEHTKDSPICVLKQMEACQEDETRCNQGAIEICKDQAWQPQEPCPLGCTEGERKATGTPVRCHACEEAEVSCFETADSKGELKKCIDHQWHTAQICEFGCIHDTCSECPEGSSVFENDVNGNCVHKICDAGFYREYETFDASCNPDFTGPGECKTGAIDCLSPGILVNCEKGDWVKKDIPCNPENPCAVLNGRQCIGRYIGQTCSEDGKQLVSCPGNTSCTAQNTCGACLSGTERCFSHDRQICVSGEYQDHPCPEGTHCEYKNTPQCVSNICKALTTKCGDDKHVYICLEENWETYIACREDEECKSHADRALCACRPGKIRCDQNIIMRCKNGEWQPPTPCPNDTRCTYFGDTGECLPIEDSPCDSLTYCDNGHLYTCHEKVYKDSGACLHGCSNRTECEPCQEDDKRCLNISDLQRCENGIAQIESCEYGCNTEQLICQECRPGISECTSINESRSCKPNGTWGASTPCAHGCLSSGKCAECASGEKRCANSNEREECLSGKWKKIKCEIGCLDGECTECKEGAKKCQNNSALTCQNGKWQSKSCEHGCYEETNDCVECTPHSMECEDKKLKHCEDNYSWSSIECEFGCNAERFECNECWPPGVTQCVHPPLTFILCLDNGKWSGPIESGCPM